jgi:hypothetical protein
MGFSWIAHNLLDTSENADEYGNDFLTISRPESAFISELFLGRAGRFQPRSGGGGPSTMSPGFSRLQSWSLPALSCLFESVALNNASRKAWTHCSDTFLFFRRAKTLIQSCNMRWKVCSM